MGLFSKDTNEFDLPAERSFMGRGIVIGVLLLLFAVWLLGWYWSREPAVFWVKDRVSEQEQQVLGYASADALMTAMNTLLDKPGGYLSNDVMPPSVFLDNIPNFEYGAVVQIRDFARAMRNDFTRSQSQSLEDPDLAIAEPAFNFDNQSWILPRTESEYADGVKALLRYQGRLIGGDAEFFARADNLRGWLSTVEKRLGDLSQQLTASVGQRRVNTNLANERSASGTDKSNDDVMVKTPWLEIDDVFYEARGSAWALLHFLRAAELDFRTVLEDKNATVSLRQVIRELEASLHPVGSPIILNGSGFGFFANHSLVMASYLSRANSAVINLRELLDKG